MAQSFSFSGRKRIRKFFGKIPEVVDMPNLIEVQKASYNQFLMIEEPPDGRPNEGLQSVFKSVFPIVDFSGVAMLEFVSYEFDPPKFDVDECRQRDLTYSAPLKVILRLIVFDIDEDTGAKSIKDIKEQSVYMGDMPLMTENGTFIINGTQRVIVSQMHRSPGVFFDHDKGKSSPSGKLLFACRIIPARGSWLDIEFDSKDIICVRIDRRRKIHVTSFLMCLGMDAEEILSTFYSKLIYSRDGNDWRVPFEPNLLFGSKAFSDLVDADTGEVVAEAGKKLTARFLNQIKDKGVKFLKATDSDLYGSYIAEDIVNFKTGEIYLEAGDEINEKNLEIIKEAGFTEIPVLYVDYVNVSPYIRNTLAVDKNESHQEALFDVYRVMRPGDIPTIAAAEAMFNSLFFDSERYDLSAVGRVKMNMRLNLDVPDTLRTIRKEDIIAIIKLLVDLRGGKGEIDDIDNLGNRRVRSVGELMENQYRVGLLRMERAIKERISSIEIDTVMPQDIINAKPVASVVREFFGSSQLSQFMDQVNPLSQITHTRRLSALGQGGLTRERAGFEVRDVHPTQYGRICPIETPEGPNIGLINSLATFARVNKYGFIESPYRKIENRKVTDNVVYLSATEEEKYYIAQANAPLEEDGFFSEEFVVCRHSGEVMLVPRDNIDLMDVSPKQLVSVAAALIPFLENDDSNRALMGSNMQRQAVPLLQAEAPFVGTGMESVVARDSGAAIVAKRAGIVDQVDATRIVIRATEDVDPSTSGVDIYRLMKFQRSNQNTCINQRPLVNVGDEVTRGDIIADGPSTDLGDLALGRNVVVAFMPWNGYNYEDSILLSERMVSDDVFTSIHMEEFEVMARDTKLGPEEITRDIPNVSEEALGSLDESGVVYIGAEVKPGDILIGKITPKGESPMTPEEKLLRAIFGEKASDVRDTSMRMPPGAYGTVIEVRVFNRHGVEKGERSIAIEREQIERLAKDRDDEQAILDRNVYGRLMGMLSGQIAITGPRDFKKGSKLSNTLVLQYPRSQWWMFAVKDEKVQEKIEALQAQYNKSKSHLERRFMDKVEKLQWGDEMPPGVMKIVKVFVAVKRKIQPGDKVAGRHGNKGVVSCIVPCEDMPFLEDGTPVDIVLNPLGVPSRMNVGQILETHLGWACVGIGKQISQLIEAYRAYQNIDPLRKFLENVIGNGPNRDSIVDFDDASILCLSNQWKSGISIATPVFDGASEKDINAMLQMAGLNESGQSILYDGRTGEQFDRPVTVGYIYMLKLNHLVDDKIHARSIGPYSLVTQQPLGGKAQFGGQRVGEMEVWALEAYGAAYTLQEMLTVKSDDVAGRTKVYEAIVRGDDTFEAGIPESFNVLVKEMHALGLSVDLENSNIDNNTKKDEVSDLTKF
ncbi:DNA-directed RNA polymerase beta subunit [Liberibacter crescens BT-1]|uniref:DNA-directed RNA polymerase subunit beta n=1 Tax=Liberibacter crescens (strain BT-1) TaxID=1215343 RepID=L0EWS6_LIBCB|nr:DNA-directed RNA polymerase subunit beta [Liberibacter crescens]AGA64836.1 DNA-directed RNA polymerase beta subunit [Liberibacter crescens BT-1]AMC12889.1 DNA-directed RNA polymerase subunit beta [Liberibacter crescens]